MGSDRGAATDPIGDLPPGQEAAEATAGPATLVIDRWRHASVRSRIATAAVQTAVRPLIRAVGPAIGDLLDRAARFERLLGFVRPPRGTHTEAVAFEDFGAEWVHGAGVARPRDRVILYLHGGGWLCCGLNTHRALTSRISAAAGIPALSVDYRMVPAVPFEEEVEDCLTAYRWLLERGTEARDITIMGDSAGGYLTFATALRARADGLPMPAALVGISGCFDLDLTGKQAHENAKRDPVGALAVLQLVLESFAGHLDTSDPAVSPVRADLSGLPPTLLVASSAEVLYCDSEDLARRLARAGVPCTLQTWERQLHVFQAFGRLLPESRASIADIGAFVRASSQA
ncbi:MAG: epsilon-lactone hydrolase [Pseudonocardiales bacterium]|nr:epsilon-lactone hydrolase [Pseudonocardiales bacterium]MDT7775517.1 epsilon-lactone hydrolase [Pseudonocardiales bacterium]